MIRHIKPFTAGAAVAAILGAQAAAQDAGSGRPGVVVQGAPGVTVGGRPVARQGDATSCGR